MSAASRRPPELRQLVRCLELHYRHGLSQKQVATRLGVSAPTVSRLLQRAMDAGYVRVELDLPRIPRLEAALIERYRLREAVVVASGGDDARERLGAAAAGWFERMLRPGLRVGLSCGFTLYETIRHLRPARVRGLALYPLSGESTLTQVDLFPNTLVGMMAAKYRPHVRAFALPVQHLVSLREIERARRRLLRDRAVRDIYEAAQDVDVALVGVGLIAGRTPGFCSLAESYGVGVGRLRALGVVGEINYQPFDAGGHVVDRPELRVLMRRILSVDAGRLQSLSRRTDRRVVAVAGGRAKVAAVRGALRGRLMNVLVTDEDCARALTAPSPRRSPAA